MTSHTFHWHDPIASRMKKNPSQLHYRGNLSLLQRRRVAIVGSRKPTPYTRQMTLEIASALSKRDVVVVSGAAMGVDAVAHQGAGSASTIAVMGNGLDVHYPAVNRHLIDSIESSGLCLSPFEDGFRPTRWSFVQRNEIVAALGEVLIVTQADLKSGSLRSVEFARDLGKEVYVLPHRIGESEGTNRLLAEGRATCIYDVEMFAERFGSCGHPADTDPLLAFCQGGRPYEEVFKAFGEKVMEYELMGKISISNGSVTVL